MQLDDKGKFRLEKDSIGEIKVPNNAMWGAVTQRSLENFQIGNDLMPFDIIRAILLIKKASAVINANLELLDHLKAEAITKSVDLILDNFEDYCQHFPLKVWQTGSGTQTNMNVNEVISYVSLHEFNEEVHPNDHVNLGQSTNDVFPSAIHIASYLLIYNTLLPSINRLSNSLESLAKNNPDVIKVGRTHLQDATPMYFSNEVYAWKKMVDKGIERIESECQSLLNLAMGGTAVGSGINTHNSFGDLVCELISTWTEKKFTSDANKYYQLSSKDTVLAVHGSLKELATSLIKIANDIRWLASGPRAGIAEIILPANEPGSSIMPGKVNPTQSEAIMQVCAQIIGNDTAVTYATAGGNFQLNVYMPLLAHNVVNSTHLLAGAIDSFTKHQIDLIKPNIKKMHQNLDSSLMLATNLTPKIGYILASKVAKHALDNNLTLKESALELTELSVEDLDLLLDPKNMV